MLGGKSCKSLFGGKPPSEKDQLPALDGLEKDLPPYNYMHVLHLSSTNRYFAGLCATQTFPPLATYLTQLVTKRLESLTLFDHGLGTWVDGYGRSHNSKWLTPPITLITSSPCSVECDFPPAGVRVVALHPSRRKKTQRRPATGSDLHGSSTCWVFPSIQKPRASRSEAR